MKPDKSVIPKYWLGKDKLKISCKEKIKVLNNNIDELQEMISDIYDEAILIGIDEKQLKEVGVKIIYFPYTKKTSSTLINDILNKERSK